MRRPVWCTCGCGEKIRVPVLPMRAQRLVKRRMREALVAAQRAQAAEIQQQLQRALQLATAPAAGNA